MIMLARKLDKDLFVALRKLGFAIADDEETAVLNEATIELFWPADRPSLLLTVNAPNSLWFSCNIRSQGIISDVMENEFADWDEDEDEEVAS
jgi:hypothetical protein